MESESLVLGSHGHEPGSHDFKTATQSLLKKDDWQRIGRQLGLSPRELEVVQQILKGKKLSAIAHTLEIALGTVKTYAQRIYRKLGVTDQRELTLMIMAVSIRLAKRTPPVRKPSG